MQLSLVMLIANTLALPAVIPITRQVNLRIKGADSWWQRQGETVTCLTIIRPNEITMTNKLKPPIR